MSPWFGVEAEYKSRAWIHLVAHLPAGVAREHVERPAPQMPALRRRAAASARRASSSGVPDHAATPAAE